MTILVLDLKPFAVIAVTIDRVKPLLCLRGAQRCPKLLKLHTNIVDSFLEILSRGGIYCAPKHPPACATEQ
jgi:hypothetical protein